jgi:hypothetical protein
MRNITGALIGAMMLFPGLATAQSHPVVVELFTSQGCSSCPPADKFLAQIADRDDVIALALHVDYWDYLGWTDVFAQPAFSKRQKDYGRAAGARSVYTPQMIVGGVDPVVGTRPMEVADLLRAHSARPEQVTVKLVRSGGTVMINAVASPPLTSAAEVQVVRYTPRTTVQIKRGENVGKTVVYANIVTKWDVVGTWDGKSPLSLSSATAGNDPVVVIVQTAGHGPILGAARLR